MINSLQSLRGIFAIMIFLSHFVIGDNDSRVFYDGGTMGVEFFIVLSGFVMCAGYEAKVKNDSITYRDFMVRRFIRIYPMHLFCLGLWLVLAYGFRELRPDVIAANALLIQAWAPAQRFFYGGNTPSWCLSVFVFLYAVFPLLIKVYARNPSSFVKVFLCFCAAYVVYIYCLPSDLNENYSLWLSRIAPPVRLIDFVFGILLWQFYSKMKDGTISRRLRAMSLLSKTMIEIIPLVLYVPFAIVAYDADLKWCSSVIWWLPTIMCVMTFSLMESDGGLISRFLGVRWLVVFGNASFCFYLLHTLVIGSVRRTLYYYDCFPGPWAMFAITLAVAIVASVVISRRLDAPLGGALRRKLL